MLERIRTVQEENLKRLDDDLDILKAYLKTERAPKPRSRRSKAWLSSSTWVGRRP
jgi:hypothetical protein